MDYADIAKQTQRAIDHARGIKPWSQTQKSAIDFDAAYAIAAHMRDARLAHGEKIVGRKIGFTNKATWNQLGISAAVWSPIYDTTVGDLNNEPFPLAPFHEPRIEPEIIIGLDDDIKKNAAIAEIEQAVAWVSLGFEIVQSIYPKWHFSTTDAVINQGMHGRLLIGDRVELSKDQRGGIADKLSALEIDLQCDGKSIAKGQGHDVLGGPVQALQHLSEIAGHDTLQDGEIITTGTLTPVLEIAAGQTWTALIDQCELPLKVPSIQFEG
ncbi:MAG: fumarylacetoacetate hydrolase family protein [Pseudomonadota bacterium]